MLFDERPKSNRKDLFDRERELDELKRSVGRPLVLLTGVRRIGKTSLLQVFVNEVDLPAVIVDCRKLKENYGWKDLYSVISEALSPSAERLIEALKGIKGISVLGNSIEISWRGRSSVSLSDLFDALNRKGAVIMLDEAQRLRGPLSREVKDAIAHSYDYDKNLTFVLTGSEVGLLYDLIGFEDQASPLYGRYYHEITVERLSAEESMEFLRRGFRELSVSVSEDVIEEIAGALDGIPGWLVFAGNEYVRSGDVRRVLEAAVNVALGELEALLKAKARSSAVAGRRYASLLKCIAEGNENWSSLEACVAESEGSTVSSSVLYNALKQLEAMSIIKDYKFLDPIYREAAKRLSPNRL